MALPQDPMAQDPAMTADPAMDPGMTAPEPEEDGFTICIHCRTDGTFEVGLEKEMSDEGTEGDELEGAQSFDNRKDALTEALRLMKADGQASAEAQFDEGFTGRAPQGM